MVSLYCFFGVFQWEPKEMKKYLTYCLILLIYCLTIWKWSGPNVFTVISFDWRLLNPVGISQRAKMRGSLTEVIPWYNKGNRQQCCGGKRRRCSHLHIKAKVLLLFKEEIKDKLPHKVGVQRVIDHFCPTELVERRETERKRKSTPDRSICTFSEREKQQTL